MIYVIKSIENIKPFEIQLKFNTGEIKTIDFMPLLYQWTKNENSIYQELLNPDYFITVKLNDELETIYWDNGIDFCPNSLYKWAS